MGDFAETVGQAYAFEGAALDLGRGVHEETLHRDAVVRLPLATAHRHGLIAGATGRGPRRPRRFWAKYGSRLERETAAEALAKRVEAAAGAECAPAEAGSASPAGRRDKPPTTPSDRRRTS